MAPQPFRRTAYFDKAMARPDRRGIAEGDIVIAMREPARTERQPDGRLRMWYRVAAQGKWLRVIVEPDGETVHNAFWDRRFKL